MMRRTCSIRSQNQIQKDWQKLWNVKKIVSFFDLSLCLFSVCKYPLSYRILHLQFCILFSEIEACKMYKLQTYKIWICCWVRIEILWKKKAWEKSQRSLQTISWFLNSPISASCCNFGRILNLSYWSLWLFRGSGRHFWLSRPSAEGHSAKVAIFNAKGRGWKWCYRLIRQKAAYTKQELSLTQISIDFFKKIGSQPFSAI